MHISAGSIFNIMHHIRRAPTLFYYYYNVYIYIYIYIYDIIIYICCVVYYNDNRLRYQQNHYVLLLIIIILFIIYISGMMLNAENNVHFLYLIVINVHRTSNQKCQIYNCNSSARIARTSSIFRKSAIPQTVNIAST